MTRGEIYTAAAHGVYSGKPRPVLIVQDDRFDATASVTVCPFTTSPVDAPLIRIPVEPTDTNGLDRPSSLMVDKITTMPRSGLGERLGRLRDDELVQLNRSLMVFLGLASATQPLNSRQSCFALPTRTPGSDAQDVLRADSAPVSNALVAESVGADAQRGLGVPGSSATPLKCPLIGRRFPDHDATLKFELLGTLLAAMSCPWCQRFGGREKIAVRSRYSAFV